MARMEQPFVTILFTDLVGSSALFDRHGDEAGDTVRREHFAALRRAVAEHGGREVKSTGDGLMVAFASAVAAVRCAADMQRATTGTMQGQALRVGLDAGEPFPEEGDLYGTSVIVASRLCDLADSGQILASDVVPDRRPADRRVASPARDDAPARDRGAGGRGRGQLAGGRAAPPAGAACPLTRDHRRRRG